MDEEYYTTSNVDEGYSPEAIANMESALEEFAVSLLEIKPEDANIAVFRGLKITMQGRPRRIAELGNVESPEGPMKIQLMIYLKYIMLNLIMDLPITFQFRMVLILELMKDLNTLHL